MLRALYNLLLRVFGSPCFRSSDTTALSAFKLHASDTLMFLLVRKALGVFHFPTVKSRQNLSNTLPNEPHHFRDCD